MLVMFRDGIEMQSVSSRPCRPLHSWIVTASIVIKQKYLFDIDWLVAKGSKIKNLPGPENGAKFKPYTVMYVNIICICGHFIILQLDVLCTKINTIVG